MKLSIVCLLLLVGCRSTADTQAASARLRPAHLRCEHEIDPLGIGVRVPRLDWRVEAVDADARGLAQSAWQILVASDAALLAEGRGDLWDSGEVRSASTTDIEYRGRPLACGSIAHWKVRVWDETGRRSSWSAPATFGVGPLDAADWKAEWIGWDATTSPPVSAGIEARWIWATGLPSYALTSRRGPWRRASRSNYRDVTMNNLAGSCDDGWRSCSTAAGSCSGGHVIVARELAAASSGSEA
jgi:hypothetical protein